MVRVQEYYETKDKAVRVLDWYKRNYPGSVLDVFETDTEGKNLCTALKKVWCVSGTQFGND